LQLDYYRSHSVDNEIPSRGPLSVLTVPGAVDGWRLAHERFGCLPWKDLFDDAIAYAGDGMAVSRSLIDWLVQDVAILTRFPATAAIFLPGGSVPDEGNRLRQAELARSFRQIADKGARAGFYQGEIAERITSVMGPQGSPLRTDDFAAFHAEWVGPGDDHEARAQERGKGTHVLRLDGLEGDPVYAGGTVVFFGQRIRLT
jgi:gamma-glutamyltranspeptidase/glutathione hydrolase